jgi:hypothetical protein
LARRFHRRGFFFFTAALRFDQRDEFLYRIDVAGFKEALL